MTMHRTIALAVLPALLAGIVEAQAHASLERANPPVGSTTSSPPREVTLRFSQKLEPAFSRVEVTGPGGQRVDKGRPTLVGDRTELRVAVKAAGSGRYRVRWHVLSVDTHTTEGGFSFTVGP